MAAVLIVPLRIILSRFVLEEVSVTNKPACIHMPIVNCLSIGKRGYRAVVFSQTSTIIYNTDNCTEAKHQCRLHAD